MKPLISIITINYNNKKGLERTIQSMVEQTFSEFEYIVIDGGSTDGSTDVIKQYTDKISYWVSEPDKGIYNAMNKGIAKAQGEYLLFINSGDELADSKSLENIYPHVSEKDIIYFDLMLQSTATKEIRIYPDKLHFSYLLFDSLPHPASFIKKELFHRIGHYDETLKICSDWAFFINAVCKHNVSYKHINNTFSVFHLDGISSSPSYQQTIANERKYILEKDFPSFTNLLNELQEARTLKYKFTHSRIIKLARLFGFLKD